MVTGDLITETVVELLRKAEVSLPGDVEKALKRAYRAEKEEIARMQLKTILDNVRYARMNNIPMCQDTGVPVFYLRLGGGLEIDLNLIEESIRRGVKKATSRIPLRPNIVHPLTRENSGDNTGAGIPVIDIEFLGDKDYLELTVFPKGAGSENMSAFRMLNPSEGVEGVKGFVLDTVASAGGNPCPPTIVGVGIGGSAEGAMKLAKKALLRGINPHEDEGIAGLEGELLKEINKLGIGPMGLGGKTTSLAVNIEYAYCHTASLPVAVNLQCWANRKASARIHVDGVEYI
ncbi:MAG: fumarate hydratase [Candidatus Altiarchaeota archaeon]|nr:fumarate hydratase [Candidatus Altiarchaeota archaeon]